MQKILLACVMLVSFSSIAGSKKKSNTVKSPSRNEIKCYSTLNRVDLFTVTPSGAIVINGEEVIYPPKNKLKDSIKKVTSAYFKNEFVSITTIKRESWIGSCRDAISYIESSI